MNTSTPLAANHFPQISPSPLLIFSQQRKQINTIFSACGHPTNFTATTNLSRFKIQEIPLWPTIEFKIKAFSLLFLLQLHWNGIFVSSFNVETDSPEKPRTARYVGMSSWIRGRSTFHAQVWLGPYFPRVYIIFCVEGSHAYHFYPCLGFGSV